MSFLIRLTHALLPYPANTIRFGLYETRESGLYGYVCGETLQPFEQYSWVILIIIWQRFCGEIGNISTVWQRLWVHTSRVLGNIFGWVINNVRFQSNYILFNCMLAIIFNNFSTLTRQPFLSNSVGFRMKKSFRRIWLRLEKFSSSNYFAVIEKGFNRSVRGQVNMTFELEQTNRVPIFFSVLFLLYTVLACRERKQHFFNPLYALPLQYKNYGMFVSSNLILSCYLWLVARMIYSSLQLIHKNINYLWLYLIV